MSMPEDERREEKMAAEDAFDDGAAEADGAAASNDDGGGDDTPKTANAEDQDPAVIIADLKDRLLRSIADMENLRNRSRREQEDALKYATTNFARDLLNVSDNLRRALESAPDGADTDSDSLKILRDGIEMTERELLSVFDRHGIEQISPLGEKFDHNKHQAMFKVPGSEAEPGTVIQVVQPGYVLRDRLLRPAMVGVAAEKNNGAGDEPPKSEGVDTQA